jgi:hypothetical protein
MDPKISVVVTSIASPNDALKALAKGCSQNNFKFILVGDTKSPQGFSLEGCEFYGINRQLQTPFAYVRQCPTRHYDRKNIGYLLAIANGSNVIFETDDDNYPLENFWHIPAFRVFGKYIENSDWLNIYKYFTDANLWPRGLALEAVQNSIPGFEHLKMKKIFCPIQQALVNGNPDVDAICRLIMPVDHTFKNNRQIAIGTRTWCPFNSQATKWTKEAFALLYLPAYCSFRMTDIWRSFIAQRISWENNWYILFHEPSMYQERNIHNLLKDFEDEIPGYLNNSHICKKLEKLDLKPGMENIPHNLNVCYEKLVTMNLVGQKELSLLNTWLKDLQTISST